MNLDRTGVVDEIEALFKSRGSESYGEKVTMFEHSLLTALTAERAGADEVLIAACLLHDIGHLLVEPDDDWGKHTHDSIGADWLSQRFALAVSEPTRHHVAAKRIPLRHRPRLPRPTFLRLAVHPHQAGRANGT